MPNGAHQHALDYLEGKLSPGYRGAAEKYLGDAVVHNLKAGGAKINGQRIEVNSKKRRVEIYNNKSKEPSRTIPFSKMGGIVEAYEKSIVGAS